MKKIYILFTVLALSACDILEQEPEALILTEEAITDRQSAVSAVNGLYSTLQSGDMYGGRFVMANEMVAGNGVATAFQAFWQELATGRIPTANFHVEGNWVAHYNTANAASKIIEEIPNITGLSDGDIDQFLGVAYFMRGLAHFDLLRQYGEFFDLNSDFGIPLKLTSTVEGEVVEVPRSTVAASYDQIEADLNEAVSRLSGGQSFFASSTAAQALLARMHLYKGEYAAAAARATDVIESGSYELVSDYNMIYTDEGSGESVFELEFAQLDDPNAYATEMYVSPPEVSVSEDLIAFFDARGETERNLLFDQTGSGLYRCIKYGSGQQDNGGNTIIIRLSEMYLIRAEALALQPGGIPNDALPDLNEVRNRSGLSNINNINNNAELRNILLDERRAEFAFEGQYWFDMSRYDLIDERRGLASFRRVYPIPFREINISDGTLAQNPGYNN